MNKKTKAKNLKLIEESIKHWEENLAICEKLIKDELYFTKIYLNGFNNTSDSCALCEAYNQTIDACEECPIHIKTGCHFCKETPYIMLVRYERKNNPKLHLKTVREEVEFLKNLKKEYQC